jgi:outer membrane protein assembly factor BamB
MKSNSDNNAEGKSTSFQRRTAVQTAVVGGVFALVVAALLAVNYVQRTVFDERRIAELDRLKIEILSRPNDGQLMGRIRQLDLEVRRDRIRRVDFSRKGGWLLAAGLVVMVVGIKWVDSLRRKLLKPELRGDVRAAQVMEATWARHAVTGAMVFLVASALVLALIPQVDFVKSSSEVGPDEIWPGFRGPGGVGVSATANVPTKWDGGTGEGILWKKKVPLPGHNSPVVWGDRVFVSGADANDRQVYCFDAGSGHLLWRGGVETQAGKTSEPLDVMEDTGLAAPTCVTDGKRVCAIFANGDVGCFDYGGKQLWTRGLGVPESVYGYASSLAIYRNLVLIQYDQALEEDEKSKMIALNVLSGQTVWETKRPVGGSWTSPIVNKVGGREQLITCGDPWVITYNPSNGEEIWRAECMGDDLAPSPIYAGGLVFAVESNIKIVAIRPAGRGDVTKTHIVWSAEDGIPDICSPVSDGELVFLLTSDGTLTCYKASDGTKVWEEDLGGYFKASPTLVGNRLYLLSEKGAMIIAEFAEGYKEVARFELGEECHACPAFVNGRIYIRSLENLYCIGSAASQEP